MPTTFVRNNGAWQQVQNYYVNNNGTWKKVKIAWVNINGVWTKSYEAVFNFIYVSSKQNANIYNDAAQAGWDGTVKLNVTINTGVILSASSTGNPAL
jgi:hypothetical protein